MTPQERAFEVTCALMRSQYPKVTIAAVRVLYEATGEAAKQAECVAVRALVDEVRGGIERDRAYIRELLS